MPELPEVETVRRGLENTLIGAQVSAVAVTGRRSVRRQTSTEFVDRLTGRRFLSALRRGKYLALSCDDGAFLVIHLRMSGQLLLADDAALPLAPHTHIVVSFADGRELRFVDPRTFGEMFVTDDVTEDGLPRPLAELGPDPLVDDLSPADLHGLMGRRRTSLKAVLLDQRAIAGIGNLYADEICFVARLRPQRRTDALSRSDCTKLARGIKEVIDAAVAARGSSFADEGYRDLFGGLGSYQADHAVYGRTGEPCVRCGTPIAHERVAGRSAHFCPRCQR